MTITGAGKREGSKLIRVSAEIVDGVVARMSIRGDFFASPEEGFDRVVARLAGAPLAELAGAFDALLADEGVEAAGISGAALAAVVDDARRALGEGRS
jgi:lipoate-protein ligase A